VRLLLLATLIACKDNSGSARQVAPPPNTERAAPEPPGGPPSCADVGAHLAVELAVLDEVHTRTQGMDLTVTGVGEDMSSGIASGIASVCRAAAWSHDARVCANGWQGNFLRELARLRDACPGTVR